MQWHGLHWGADGSSKSLMLCSVSWAADQRLKALYLDYQYLCFQPRAHAGSGMPPGLVPFSRFPAAMVASLEVLVVATFFLQASPAVLQGWIAALIASLEVLVVATFSAGKSGCGQLDLRVGISDPGDTQVQWSAHVAPGNPQFFQPLAWALMADSESATPAHCPPADAAVAHRAALELLGVFGALHRLPCAALQVRAELEGSGVHLEHAQWLYFCV